MSVVKIGVTGNPDDARTVTEEDIARLALPAASQIQETGAKSWIRRFPGKRSFDLALSGVLLILLAPLLLSIALILRLSSQGPVLFVQQRNGYAKQRFGMYKFRTMKVMEDGHRAVQCRPNDSRVTSIGRFLRRTSLDELPQLINVVNGEMSLVGPRPHPINLDSQFSMVIPGYDHRFSTPPGLTGLAQVMGYRGPTQTIEDMQRRISADLAYADGRSLAADIRILAATAPALWFHKNAC